MAGDPMKNPYDDWEAPETFAIGRGAMWCLLAAFMLVCLVPPTYRNVYEAVKRPRETDPRWVPVVEIFRKGDQTLDAHLDAYEKQLDKGTFRDGPRRIVQKSLTALLRAGNTKTAIGREGWLYFQPAVDGLTGYGPLEPEPDSVAKDPTRAPWSGPKDVIVRFARQLHAFGVELVLVPVPVKPMIYPEYLAAGAFDGPVRHRDAARFFAGFEAEPNVTVVDLADTFWAMKESGPVFLKQDTHWTPGAMERAAAEVAKVLRARPWFGELPADPARFEVAQAEQRASIGDLVEKLDVLPEINANVPQAGFDLEGATVRPVLETSTGRPPAVDRDSPVVLLGDSFTNIYGRAGDLNWGTGAGFGEHLARELGLPLDSIAINGEAATGVRARLAERTGAAQAMRAKKVLVWVVAARDLFLSESAAARNDVRWADVEFNDAPASLLGSPAKVEATLRMKSEFPDPATVPYNDALYAAEYEVERVIDGGNLTEGDRIAVVHWAFEGKRLKAAAHYAVGSRRVLDLVPFESMDAFQTMQLAADTDPLMATYWAKEAAAPADTGDANRPARLIASGACVVASLAVLVMFGGIAHISSRRNLPRP